MRFDGSESSLRKGGLPLDPLKRESAMALPYGRQRESSLDSLSLFIRHRWLLASCVLVGLFAGCWIGLLQIPAYRAETSLEIQPVNDNYFDLKDAHPIRAADVLSIDRYIQTQAEILASDGVLDPVIDRLNLRNQPEFLPKRSKLDELRTWFGLRVKPLGEVPPIELVAAVRSRLTTEVSHTSCIIRVKFVSRDPELAASFLNVLSDEYSQQNAGTSRTESLETSWLGRQLEQLKRQTARVNTKTMDGVQQAAVVADQSASAVRNHILEQSAATDKQIDDEILRRVKEAGVSATLRPKPIRVISRAKTPAKPFSPNIPLNAAVGGLAGLWIGIAATVYVSQSNRRLRAPGDFEQLLNVPELGAVPNIGKSNRLGAASTFFRHALKPVGLVAWQSNSDACDSFRNIAASILADCEREKAKRVLLFTSAWPTEGKSTVASNVAVSLAESGRRVLLIDCDLRSPRQQDIFDVPNSWGLRDVLRDGDRLAGLPVESLVKPTGIVGLHLLPSGPGVDNITSLLYSPRFGTLIGRMRKHFDFVLIDAPPLLRFADARIVAGQCDAAVIVHRANMTTQTAAVWTVQRLLAHKVPIAGSILNDCPPDLDNDRYPSSSYYSRFEKHA